MSDVVWKDYSITEETSDRALEQGLALADWYTTDIPREKMKELLVRKNGPAIRDTAIWFALLISSGICGYLLWGTWWAIIPFAIYGVIYASTSDSRWHEASHGTAFKSDWMNNALYEIASFMVFRESTPWRWSHNRHHSDTIIRGRDPEIVVPRPPDLWGIFLSFFALRSIRIEFKKMLMHSVGKLTVAERTYIPAREHGKVFFKARIYVLLYVSVVALAVYTHSMLPLMYVILPTLYGSWLMPLYGYTQHAGLAENVLDHRFNCRTVYMNPINRYLYWNMNYHVEHHMFPLVPYHALPELHELMKHDTPKPYNGIIETFREIIPTILRQVKDPGYHVRRILPDTAARTTERRTCNVITTTETHDADGWIEVGDSDLLSKEDVIRFDHEDRTFAIYHTAENNVYATDGMCTHGNTHLADGVLMGNQIECPKHNGRFDIADGSAQRSPVCVALKTYDTRVTDGKLYLNLVSAGGCGAAEQETHSFKVVSNENVATFIKELVLEPLEASTKLDYKPGDYIQLDIPDYDELTLKDIHVQQPYADVWRAQHIHDFRATNKAPTRRNYSLATNPAVDDQLRFNVRIASPPAGVLCNAGVGSTYVFNLKPGDVVTAVGPFGDFHIKPTDSEMVYIGGGAGMAPLKSHISHLFDTEKTTRKISYWYGARSLQELFYQSWFEKLDEDNENFTFKVALSEPSDDDNYTGETGFIHEVFRKEYLENHPDPTRIEYYLCGPPEMIQASRQMLFELNVGESQIAFDEF